MRQGSDIQQSNESTQLLDLQEIPLAPLPAPEPSEARLREELLGPAHDDAIARVLSHRVAKEGPDQRLPVLIEPESRFKRGLFLLIALAITVGYAYVVRSYWAPAHPGVDQNGYLVGGKNFAGTFSSGMRVPNPFSYVGWMWLKVGDPDASGHVWYYPKYPLGLPMLDALCLWIGGTRRGVELSYMVSPACTVLAVLATFFFARRLAGSFAGVLAMLLMGFCPVTLVLANNPNSHAPALAFVCWGMLMLLLWWQKGGWWRGALAGVLLGYAVTIRYTEGLLLLPLAVVALMTIRWSDPKSYLRAAVPILAWAAPVVALLAFNKVAMGSWTGYDTTNESTGFTWKEFQAKWQFMLGQLHDTGLFFLLPLGVLGMGLIYRWNWRVALLMTMWFVPGTLLYTSYYWGLETRGVGYLRFFLTLFPPVVICAAWLLQYAGNLIPVDGHGGVGAVPWRRGSIVAPIAAGVVVAIAIGVNVYENVGAMERDFTIATNLADTGHRLFTIPNLPPPPAEASKRPILFGDQRQLLNYLQFAGDFECYGQDVFTSRYHMRMLGGSEKDAPNPLQKARLEYIAKVYKDKTDGDLQMEQNKLIRDALTSGRRVFVALPSSFMTLFRGRLNTAEFTAVSIERWREPAAMSDEGKKALANLGFGAGLMMGRGVPQNWEIVEIKRKT
jgi:4-amino-4-deoxy-L-arabinose transferase-like glycosyltransferase